MPENPSKSISARRKICVVIIKPSKYDDDGYVIRHFRGVLPSNTLACLSSLTQDVADRGLLGSDVELEIEIFDDTVQKIPVERIIRKQKLPRRRVVIALAGVQSNQFPRAADLAKKFRAGGLQVLMGGFHVSGALALSPGITPEIQELLDIGVTVVKGEVEDTWGDLLRDADADRLLPLYNFMDCKPDLAHKPIPMISGKYLKKFIVSNFGTIDCSRGCPFSCSFCTIINVQGRKMRVRAAETMINTLRENYRSRKLYFYFFTDDNFARNTNWREIFNGLAKLREEENIPIQFMMQIDTQSHTIPDFIPMAARAGCSQVFIGMESINPQNLKAAGKHQNKTEDYKNLIAAWHDAKIATHVAYIFGFPFDTPESLREDVRRLQEELHVDHASFFMLTPIPGSQDHAEMVAGGGEMHPDLNDYDSFHETIRHPNFAPGELSDSYREAWKNFYSFKYMKEVLSGANPENYWNILLDFLWYKNSALIEGGHPMLHGFFRLKDRVDRRSGYAVESRTDHLCRRTREVARMLRSWTLLLLEMEELWLQTRIRSDAEKRLHIEIENLRKQLKRNLRSAELQLAHMRTRLHFPEIHVPSRLSLAFRDFNFAMSKRLTYSRTDLKLFWRRGFRLKTLFARPLKVVFHLLKDAKLFLMFVRDMARA